MIHYGLLLLIGTLAVDAATVVNTTLEGPSPDSNSVTCPDHYVSIGNRCLRFDLSASGSWDEMREYCKLQNADLVILMDPQFFVDVSHHLRSVDATADFWIGATDVEQEGRWVWLDGSPVDMGTLLECVWVRLPPTAQWRHRPNCAQLSGGLHHFFSDSPCTQMAHPICQMQ